VNGASPTVAVVTGACGGIGCALVGRFLAAGLAVCLTDRDAAALDAQATALVARVSADRVLGVPMDVTSSASIDAARARVTERFARVDVLVNNAGVFARRGFQDVTERELRDVLEVNVMGTFRVTQAFVPTMVAQRAGHVVNIGSVAALKGAAHAAHYAASKAAVAALGRSLALELGAHGIRVNTVHPGFIDTPMLGESRAAMRALVGWRVPSRRLGRPEEVAEAVWALVATESVYLTGAELVIDGGVSLG
jgi:3alpha(or 20beta)-hydroxysteroid dehydrogenase